MDESTTDGHGFGDEPSHVSEQGHIHNHKLSVAHEYSQETHDDALEMAERGIKRLKGIDGTESSVAGQEEELGERKLQPISTS